MNDDNCSHLEKDTYFTPCTRVNSKGARDINGEEQKEERQEEGRRERKTYPGLRWHM